MGSTRKVWLGCATLSIFAVVAALSPGLAHASEVATRLDYSAAPGCPGAEDFSAAVVGRLGYSPFRKDASERVVVRIEPAGKALEGRLEWRDAAGGWIGEQTLPSRTGNCPELVRAMGFALAVQFQLMATAAGAPSRELPPPVPARAQPPAPAPKGLGPPAPSTISPSVSAATPASSPTSVTAPPPTTTLQPTAPPPLPPVESLPATVTSGAAATRSSDTSSSGPSLTLGVGAAVAFGAAPSAVPLGRLFGAVGWTHVIVELAGEISDLSTGRREDGAGFTHRQALGSLAGCGVVRSWGACLVAKAGEIRVKGQGVDVPAPATGFVMQMGARLTWTHIFGERFEIAARADGLALATEGKVTLDSMPVWTTPRFTASLGIDVGVRFR